ncbi:MAG: hypothetical protein SPI77_00935 [Corynebacterium sp.]|nr:hypothetical protein [Corynebacterium sp.]
MTSLTTRRFVAASVASLSLATALSVPQVASAASPVIENLSTKTQDGTSTKLDDDIKALNELGNGFWSQEGSTKAAANIDKARETYETVYGADRVSGHKDPLGTVANARTELEARKLEKALFDMQLVAVIVLPLLAVLGIATYMGVLPF